MNNLFVLWKYELKKLLQKRLTKAMLLLLALTVLLVCIEPMTSDFYRNGQVFCSYTDYQKSIRENMQALGQSRLDQALLEATKAGFDAETQKKAEYGSQPTEEQRAAINAVFREKAFPYFNVYLRIRDISGMTREEFEQWQPDETELYAMRDHMKEEYWSESQLTESEKAFWAEKETQVEKPFAISYMTGWELLFNYSNTISLMILLAISVCLSSLFPEEHVRKTDQLLLCSRQGRTTAYLAKMLAGVSFALMTSLAYVAALFSFTFLLYGADGGSTPMQLLFTYYSYPLSTAQAVAIFCGCMIAAVLMFSIFVMIFSELTRNGIAALAMAVGLIFAGMIIQIPDEYRFASHLWSSLPSLFANVWNVFDQRMFSLGGVLLTAWQAVPVFYLLAAVILCLAGSFIYRRYQISGR